MKCFACLEADIYGYMLDGNVHYMLCEYCLTFVFNGDPHILDKEE